MLAAVSSSVQWWRGLYCTECTSASSLSTPLYSNPSEIYLHILMRVGPSLQPRIFLFALPLSLLGSCQLASIGGFNIKCKNITLFFHLQSVLTSRTDSETWTKFAEALGIFEFKFRRKVWLDIKRIILPWQNLIGRSILHFACDGEFSYFWVQFQL